MSLVADMDNDEFKQMIVKNIISDLKEAGFEVDPEQPEESLQKIREIANEKAKEFGFDFSNGVSFGSIKSTMLEKLRAFGVPIGKTPPLLLRKKLYLKRYLSISKIIRKKYGN